MITDDTVAVDHVHDVPPCTESQIQYTPQVKGAWRRHWALLMESGAESDSECRPGRVSSLTDVANKTDDDAA